MSSKQSIDMVEGSLLKNIVRFSIPLMISEILQIFFNSADAMIVGRFCGQNALAAVGGCTPVIILFTWPLSGLSLGSNVLLSGLIGANKENDIPNAVYTSVICGFIAGSLIATVGVIATPLFLRLLAIPEVILQSSTVYMRIYFLAAIPISVFQFCAAVMRASGDSKHPTIYLATAGGLNVLGNLFFVLVLHIDVAGVAVSTLLTQIFASAWALLSLKNRKDILRLDVSNCHLDIQNMQSILRVGIPSAIQNALFSLTNVFIQSSINQFGTAAIAANSAANAVEEYVYIALEGFTQASVTFTSQNYGAKQFARVKQTLLITMGLAGIFGALIGWTGWYFGDFFLSFFTNDPTVISLGMIRLTYVTRFLFVNGLLDCIAASLRGMGYSIQPTIITLTGITGVRLLYLCTIFVKNHTLPTLYMCFPISWLLTTIALAILWLSLFKRVQLQQH